MSDRIVLNFGANTRDVEQGADRMADSLDKTERKLDDLGSAGEDAGQAAAEGLDDASTAAGDLGGSLGSMGNVATAVLEGDVAGGARSAVDALSGLADAVPVVGAALGAGLALAANFFIGQWENAAKANEDRIRAMYEDMIESGNDFASDSAINAGIDAIIQDNGRLAEVQRDAAQAGVSLSLALRAEAGDHLALSTVLSSLRQKREDLNAQQEAYIAKNGDVSAALDEQIGGLDLLETALESYGTAADTAGSKAEIYRQATEGFGTAVGDLTTALEGVPASVYAGVEVTGLPEAEQAVSDFVTRVSNKRIRITVRGVDEYGRTLQ